METIYYEGSQGRETLELKKKRDFYPVVARKMSTQENGLTLQAKAGIDDVHYATFNIGMRSGTQNITTGYDSMPEEYKPKTRKKRYLAFIDPDKNSYKCYIMNPPKDGYFEAEYGRMATNYNDMFGMRSCKWEAEMYDVKLQEKLHKGYIDLSEYMLAKDETKLQKPSSSRKEEQEHTASRELFELLHASAKRVVEREVNVPVNQTIIDKADELIGQLRSDAGEGSVKKFNKTLMMLMLILQRRIPTGDGMGVKRMLADDESDFGRIIVREKDLLEAMKGSVVKSGSDAAGDFSDYGIEVYDATPEQVKFVERHLGGELKDKMKHVWRVIPKEQKKRFDAYVENNGISPVKCFWHGSRNENWASIIINSLKLNPDAQITGKMFGQGIYFAPSPSKSFGYTSYYGSRWANGTNGTAFMGLCATAYGKPMDVNSRVGDYRNKVINGGYGCCHAHKNTGFLYNDEVVFYNEDAILLEYIVEFQ